MPAPKPTPPAGEARHCPVCEGWFTGLHERCPGVPYPDAAAKCGRCNTTQNLRIFCKFCEARLRFERNERDAVAIRRAALEEAAQHVRLHAPILGTVNAEMMADRILKLASAPPATK